MQIFISSAYRGLWTRSPKPELAARILEARENLKLRLVDPEIGSLVEPFDRDKYNDNMSVAENLMFGTPRDDALQADKLADNTYVRRVLEEHQVNPTLSRHRATNCRGDG